MYQFPIGAMLDSFRTDAKTAVEKAAALGVKEFKCMLPPENLHRKI